MSRLILAANKTSFFLQKLHFQRGKIIPPSLVQPLRKKMKWSVISITTGLYDKQYFSGHKFSIIITGFGYSLRCGFEDENLGTFVH